jgi:hypothetical protein
LLVRAYFDDKVDVRRGMIDAEDGGATESGNILEGNMLPQHLLHVLRIQIKIEIFRDFLSLFCIIERHRCKDGFDFEVKSGIENMIIIEGDDNIFILQLQASNKNTVTQMLRRNCGLHTPLDNFLLQ